MPHNCTLLFHCPRVEVHVEESVDCAVGEFRETETCVSFDYRHHNGLLVNSPKTIPSSSLFVVQLQLKTQETRDDNGGNGCGELMKPIGRGGMWIVNNDHVLMTEKGKRQGN